MVSLWHDRGWLGLLSLLAEPFGALVLAGLTLKSPTWHCTPMDLDVETPVKLAVRKYARTTKLRPAPCPKRVSREKTKKRRTQPKPSPNTKYVRQLLRQVALPSGTNQTNSKFKVPEVLRLGSDCSGYGSEFLALIQIGLPVKTVFCSEIDANKVKMLNRMHAIHHDVDYHLYTDIKARDCSTAPECDIFVSGAPCQAFSSAGRGAGLDDLKDRGVTLFYSLDYVRHKRPKLVVIENVKGLTFKKHAHVLQSVIAILEGLKYIVDKHLVNTCNHGLPQNRPRLYIIAILASAKRHKLEWPMHVVEPDIARFLDLEQTGRKRDINTLNPVALGNIVHFRKNKEETCGYPQ